MGVGPTFAQRRYFRPGVGSTLDQPGLLFWLFLERWFTFVGVFRRGYLVAVAVRISVV